MSGLREAVEHLAESWGNETAADWHFVHGPAGDNLDPDKASPAIGMILEEIRQDLRAVLLADASQAGDPS